MASIIKKINKFTLWEKIMWVLILLIFYVLSVNYFTSMKEGFEKKPNESNKLVVKKGRDIYDNFYTKFYDKLVFCKAKNDFEVGVILKVTNPTKNSKILDIGSGTGHHVAAFTENGIDAVGLDVSSSMVNVSKELYPSSNYMVGDALETMLFPPETFTHITCLYFTIYYIKDKQTFIHNCYNWLSPGGFMVLHLVDRDRFDPILPAGDPFYIISPQHYAKKRITSTVVKFKGYDYRSNFEYNPKRDEASMNEHFKNTKTGDVRKNEHTLFMQTQKQILAIAKDAGFILHSQHSMLQCQYEKQYIYILQKSN